MGGALQPGRTYLRGNRVKKLGAVAILVVAFTAAAYAVTIIADSAWALQALLDPSARAEGLILLAWTLASSLVLLAAAYYLIRNRERLADRWFDEVGVSISVSEQGLIRVGLVMIGIVLLTWGLPDLIGALGRLATASIQQKMLGLDEVQSTADRLSSIRAIVVVILQMLLGGVLVWRNAPFSQMLWSPESREPLPAATRAACPNCGSSYDPDDYADLATARCVECRQPLVTDA